MSTLELGKLGRADANWPAGGGLTQEDQLVRRDHARRPPESAVQHRVRRGRHADAKRQLAIEKQREAGSLQQPTSGLGVLLKRWSVMPRRPDADIVVAVALGADMAFIGRPYVYAVAAAGQRGVEHLIKLLTDQMQSVMQFSGVTTLAELRKQGAELLSEPV